MAALAWLLIPVMGCLLAALWGSWAARRRTGAGGVQDTSGVRRYEAFRAAMERPSLAGRGPRRRFGRRRRIALVPPGSRTVPPPGAAAARESAPTDS